MSNLDKLLDKISSYNIINYLLPGGVFCYLFQYFAGVNFLHMGVDLSKMSAGGAITSIVESLFIYYFVGIVISRVGSLLIEPFSQKMHLIDLTDEEGFAAASKEDSKLDVLLETNNLYRTMSAGFFLLFELRFFLTFRVSIQSIQDFFHFLAERVFTASFFNNFGSVCKGAFDLVILKMQDYFISLCFCAAAFTLGILFILAFRKQTKHVQNRVRIILAQIEKAKKEAKEEKEKNEKKE